MKLLTVFLVLVFGNPDGTTEFQAAALESPDQCVQILSIIENDFRLQQEAFDNLYDQEYDWYLIPERRELIKGSCMVYEMNLGRLS